MPFCVPSNPLLRGRIGRRFDGALGIPVTSQHDPLQLITQAVNKSEWTLGHAPENERACVSPPRSMKHTNLTYNNGKQPDLMFKV